MKQRLSDGAATALIALIALLAGSLLRPGDVPAAGRVTEAAIIIVTATPTIGIPPVADIPAPTAVPQVEPPTPVPPLAVEPVQVQYVAPSQPVVQVIEPQPAIATPDLPPRHTGETFGGKPNRRNAPPEYSANPIHDAPEAVQP